MNNIALAGALFVALATPWYAIAQAPAPAPAAKQAGAPPAAAAPAGKQTGTPAAAPTPKAAAAAPITAAVPPAAEPEKPVKRVSHRVPSKADARACLEFPTTAQIIKCAEKYRWAS